MKLNNKKATIARMLKVGKSRVFIDSNSLKDVKGAITKADLRSLVNKGILIKKKKVGNSRYRVRRRALLKRHGRVKGVGKRRGRFTARNPSKIDWMIRIRNQRALLKKLKLKKLLTTEVYRRLYKMAKGGFFKSKRHLRTYIEERNLIKK